MIFFRIYGSAIAIITASHKYSQLLLAGVKRQVEQH